MNNPTVKVSGSASVPGELDEVEFRVTISALRPTPEQALNDVSRRSAILEETFDELGIRKTQWSTRGVSVREERDWIKDRYVDRGHRASNVINVTLDDTPLAGKVIQAVTDHADVGIDGPWWKIALDNPARVTACREAALDARRKAEAYADALEMRVGSVVSVVEPGLEDYRGSSDHEMVMYEAAPELTINPGELDISAQVVIVFELVEGSRGL